MTNHTPLPHTAKLALDDMTRCGITLTVQNDSVLTAHGIELRPILYPQGGQFLPRHLPFIHRYKEHYVQYAIEQGNLMPGYQPVETCRVEGIGFATGGLATNSLDWRNRERQMLESSIHPVAGSGGTVRNAPYTPDQEKYLLSIYKLDGVWPTYANTEINAERKMMIMTQLRLLGPERLVWDAIRLKAQKLAKAAE